jgi:hypothetical protein
MGEKTGAGYPKRTGSKRYAVNRGNDFIRLSRRRCAKRLLLFDFGAPVPLGTNIVGLVLIVGIIAPR